MHSSSPKNNQTNGPLEFIQIIVDKVKEELEGLVLKILSKIFLILLSLKADNTEKIIKIVRFAISTVLKIWSGQN